MRLRTFARLLAATALCSAAVQADARVTRITVDSVKPLPIKDGAIPYETVIGTFTGEVDPTADRIITDLDKAPRNARGKVEYSATFAIARPVDPSRGSGVLFYDVPNRGFGGVASDPDGHIRVVSGWQGDIPPGAGLQTAIVPVARNADGSSITGPVMARFTDIAAGKTTIDIAAGLGRGVPRPLPVSFETSKARLILAKQGQPDRDMPASDWAFADCASSAFPGTANPAKLCVKGGFDPDAAYTLAYEGKDPLVLGLGFAMTRDFIAFLRSGKADDADTANPAGSAIRWTVGVGNSQSGNYLRSFLNLGFNRDEAGGRVFDGINPNIAARHVPLNLRFAVPGGAANLFEPGSEGVLWWSPVNDTVRGRGTGSLLTRCTTTKTCPKIIETFGSAEFWNLRASPGLVGLDAKRDIPLPSNVRRYYFPGVTHGGGRGKMFVVNGDAASGCALRGNPNPIAETLMVARKMLVDWVKTGQQPLPSRYPRFAKAELAAPAAKAIHWLAIPGAPLPDSHINPLYDYDLGPSYLYPDVSGVIDRQPPVIKRIFPQLVPVVNADGNETSGVPSVALQVPLGTYTGWNVQTNGYGAGGFCGLNGGFIPFARTKAEREAKGDLRLSLEERYRNHAGFVAQVRSTVAAQQKAGWLLPDDAARIAREAEESDVLK